MSDGRMSLLHRHLPGPAGHAPALVAGFVFLPSTQGKSPEPSDTIGCRIGNVNDKTCPPFRYALLVAGRRLRGTPLDGAG